MIPAGVRTESRAKEAVYKAWYPLARTWVGFEEAPVTFDASDTFTARILVPGPVSEFSGRWTVDDGPLATAIAVPAGSS